MMRWFEKAGFDRPRLAFAFRTAVAACIAFVAAWMLGLEHPQWAGMAVWAASQPVRGQLLEKSFFRFTGTVAGTIAGIALVQAMALHPSALVIGLALWVGLCTGLGNLQRGLVAYGTVLAGYTAAMVSLLDSTHPDHVLALGADRMATVLTGVIVATLVGYFFAPPADGRRLRARVRALIVDLLAHAARPHGATDKSAEALLQRIAEIEDQLDPHGAGSIRSRRDIRMIRAMLIAAVPILLRAEDIDATAALALEAASDALRREQPDEADEAFRTAIAATAPDSELMDALVTLHVPIMRWARNLPERARPEKALPVILHQDWDRARKAFLRASGTMLLFGLLWYATGIAVGNFMLLGLSVMLSLFSTFENPARMMRYVLVGQVLGVVGALACRWLVWPLAGSELDVILLTLPFILFGPFLIGHNRTQAVSFDYNMVLLLMLHPAWPLTGTMETSFAAGLAVIAAPLAALLAFSYVFPVTPRRELRALLSTMLHDLSALAASATAESTRQHWRARAYHRTIRVMRLSGKIGGHDSVSLKTSLALLRLQSAVMLCHKLAGAAATDEAVKRNARHALESMTQLTDAPDKAVSALHDLAKHTAPKEAAELNQASTDLTHIAQDVIASSN